MSYNQEFADYIRPLITNRSQRQLAVKVGVSQTTIGNMLLGHVPKIDILDRLADVLGVSREDMRLMAYGRTSLPTNIVTSVDIALRGATNISETGKRQIAAFVREMQEKYPCEQKDSSSIAPQAGSRFDILPEQMRNNEIPLINKEEESSKNEEESATVARVVRNLETARLAQKDIREQGEIRSDQAKNTE